jgi:lysophospholipid acyltransferase (LPLAT)-like uncharacterized protein
MKALPFVASLFIRTLRLTLRVRHVRVRNIERPPQYILAFWHAHLLLMLHCRFRRPIAVMTSRSKDGEIMARVFDWYGVQSARGSSSRGGGAALRELIRYARAGSNLVFTPDGPTGPPRIAKDGVIYAAQSTGLPVVPIAFAAKKKVAALLGPHGRPVSVLAGDLPLWRADSRAARRQRRGVAPSRGRCDERPRRIGRGALRRPLEGGRALTF